MSEAHNLVVENLLRLVRHHRETCSGESCTISLMIVKQAVLEALDPGDELRDDEVELFF